GVSDARPRRRGVARGQAPDPGSRDHAAGDGVGPGPPSPAGACDRTASGTAAPRTLAVTPAFPTARVPRRAVSGGWSGEGPDTTRGAAGGRGRWGCRPRRWSAPRAWPRRAIADSAWRSVAGPAAPHRAAAPAAIDRSERAGGDVQASPRSEESGRTTIAAP